MTVRVESLPTVWTDFADFLELDCELPTIEKNINSNKDMKEYHPVTWDELKDCSVELYDRVRWYAERVGYI